MSRSMFKQNDEDFLKHFIPGQGNPTVNARMQLKRLIGEDDRAVRAPFCHGLSDPQQLRSSTVSSIVLGDFSCVR